MDPEQGVVLHRLDGVVELQVVLVLEVGGHARPQGLDVVDDLVLVGIDILAVFPLLLLAEDDGHGQETAILLQQALDASGLEEFLLVFVKRQNNVGAALGLVTVLHLKLRRAVTRPVHGLGAFLPAQGAYFHLLGHHEGRVETQTEVTDDGIGGVLVFLEELLGSREGDLVDVLVDFLGCHADAAVAHGERSGLLIDGDGHAQPFGRAFEFTGSREGFELLGGIDGIAHELAQENLVITVQKLLDNGENVVSRYPNCSFWHIFLYNV